MSSSDEEIKLGMKLRLAKDSKENQEYFVSQVLDVIDENNLLISGPIKESRIIPIHTEELLDIYYVVENKGIYSFSAKVISRENSPIYTLKIEKTTDIKKAQQREYYRLFLKVDVKKNHIITENNQVTTYKEKCESIDISGGGMRLYCNYHHRVNDEITLIFKIGELKINVKAIVRRTEKVDNLKYKYSIGVSFENLKEADRDDLIRYIFEKQRILRNEGLI